jgi:hypothetical protein
MGTIYRVHEGNPRLQYYTNTLDYYTLNNTEEAWWWTQELATQR